MIQRRHVLLAVPLLGSAGPTRAAPAAAGTAVQWPVVDLLGGGQFGPAQAAGHAVVVVFWSLTCPFCRRHNQHVEKLHRQAQGRRLKVLTVSRDRQPADVQRYVAQQGYSFPVTLAHAAMAQALSPRNVIPLTMTVDRTGLLKQVYPGEMFEEDVLEFLDLGS